MWDNTLYMSRSWVNQTVVKVPAKAEPFLAALTLATGSSEMSTAPFPCAWSATVLYLIDCRYVTGEIFYFLTSDIVTSGSYSPIIKLVLKLGPPYFAIYQSDFSKNKVKPESGTGNFIYLSLSLFTFIFHYYGTVICSVRSWFFIISSKFFIISWLMTSVLKHF